MKKHPFILIVAILVIVGLVLGLSATDVWEYFIEICRTGIQIFMAWLNEIILALRDSLASMTV